MPPRISTNIVVRYTGAVARSPPASEELSSAEQIFTRALGGPTIHQL